MGIFFRDTELIEYLSKKGLINKDRANVTPLTGGVSSQILLIDDGIRRFVLKRALEKLKVKEDWFADVNRNQIEQQYLKYVCRFMAHAVPTIMYSDTEHHFFCMEMLENDLLNWKEQLLNKQYDIAYARTAGEVMATIHNKSMGDAKAKKTFDTLENFNQLRIEPYLLACGRKHAKISTYFNKEADRLSSIKTCLVHGDFSPKNILVSPGRFVLLDCEVAWYGDPIFDIAFLLNHFVLKALLLSEDASILMNLANEIWNSYEDHAGSIIHEKFESQVIHLLYMLMLARVDGKSPVEYLNEEQQDIVKDFVYNELPNNSRTFKEFKIKWLKKIR